MLLKANIKWTISP